MTTRTFYVEISAQASPAGSAAELEAFVELLTDALQDEPGVKDADVGADLGSGRIDFCLHLDADSSVAALRQAQVVARSAAHAVGARTPGWEEFLQVIRDDDALSSVRPADATVPTAAVQPSGSASR